MEINMHEIAIEFMNSKYFRGPKTLEEDLKKYLEEVYLKKQKENS